MKMHAMGTVLVAVILLSLGSLTGAATNEYSEDFSTADYMDALNTTAWWDIVAGEIKLPFFEMSIIGNLDTPLHAIYMDISGDYLYLTDQGGGAGAIKVVDISDPANPSLAGSISTPGEARHVTVEGDYAYVTGTYYGPHGLYVYDISDPTNPFLAGSHGTSDIAQCVAVAGDCAYVAARAAGLYVFDISDPKNPVQIGNYDSPGYPDVVIVEGDYAYITDAHLGLKVVDISDPTTPTLAGEYDTPDYARGLAIAGDYLYLCDRTTGLLVIDVSDPTDPTLAGSYDTPVSATTVAISGDYAYIADGNGGDLLLLDISDPTSPTLMESLDTPGLPYAVVVEGDHAYVGDYEAGLQVVKIAEPASAPLYAGSCDTPCDAHGIALAGNHAYVADAHHGLQVIDISDPTSPNIVGSHDIPDWARGVAISGDYAYLGGGNSGLQVIDISYPTAPFWAGSYDTPGNAWGVAVAGDYAYVGDQSSGLQVIDISNPTDPTYAGSFNTSGTAKGVAIAGDYAYVGDGYSGLQVIDISNPTTPFLAGNYNTPGRARGVALAGDYAYVGDWHSGLQVIDISDPKNPIYAGSCDTPAEACWVALAGNYACVADGASGLQMIDISDPKNPTYVGSYNTPGWGHCVAIAGDHVFMADQYSGLQVFEIFNRRFDIEADVAQSVIIDDIDDPIQRLRLSTNQTGSVLWDLSVDGGANWEESFPGDIWQAVSPPGNDLLWRSKHVYQAGLLRVNPACSDLSIEWLYEFPCIGAVTDIPNDQGRQVRITWMRGSHDFPGDSTPIIQYAIYRLIDDDLREAPLSAAQAAHLDPALVDSRARDWPPGDWDFTAMVPACCEDDYATVVPTLADSSIVDGMYFTTFFVRALTATPSIYFDAPPDSGYSVDNLAPHVPEGFMVIYDYYEGNELSWEESIDEDFQYFRIYRGDMEVGLEPSAADLIHETVATEWIDTEGGVRHYYEITAVDFSGNESDPAVPGTIVSAPEGAAPGCFALHQNLPNPFNPSTTIRFDVPAGGGPVSLTVFDVGGRHVRGLVDAMLPPGRHSVVWRGRDDAGRSLGSGVYLCQLNAPGFTGKHKMLLIK